MPEPVGWPGGATGKNRDCPVNPWDDRCQGIRTRLTQLFRPGKFDQRISDFAVYDVLYGYWIAFLGDAFPDSRSNLEHEFVRSDDHAGDPGVDLIKGDQCRTFGCDYRKRHARKIPLDFKLVKHRLAFVRSLRLIRKCAAGSPTDRNLNSLAASRDRPEEATPTSA